METDITMKQINKAWKNYVNSHISTPPTKTNNFILDLPTITPLGLTKTEFTIKCQEDHDFFYKYYSPKNNDN